MSSRAIGASRMPASAAMEHDNAHDSWRIRVGCPPAIASRSGLSTTARIEMPVRVWLNRILRPMAIAIVAMTATISW